ncbi:hypothetical protein [Bacillus sp. FJAT-53060]|uniref:hypothetical protein n=1 Tax=Bacillus sp. FJAT-53060 TaxID=3127666 RepID=UPI003FA573F5
MDHNTSETITPHLPQTPSIRTVLSFNTAIMNIGMMLGSSIGVVIIQYTKITYLSWIGGLASLAALMNSLLVL